MRIALGIYLTLCAILLPTQRVLAAEPADVLTESEWEEVNDSVDRALAWLATQQQSDGSFPTLPHGQPGVTGLVTLAFLTQGHLPGEGEYGGLLDSSLDFIADCQSQNGLLAVGVPETAKLSREITNHRVGIAASYNHAIAGMVLSETYAMAGAERVQRMQPVIEKALEVTFEMQDWPKDIPKDEGGWRYLIDKDQYDSDLSITGWQLMFLRSAKNAGFDIEQQRIDRAIGYIQRSFRNDVGTFVYKSEPRGRSSRGLAGAGILALAHSGMHHTEEAQQAGKWILKVGFRNFNSPGLNTRRETRRGDRYFYGLLTCSQAMYQLGGNYWSEFFPPTARVLIVNQNSDGSWDREHHDNRKWGNSYTTAIGVIALNASNQLLPVFQR